MNSLSHRPDKFITAAATAFALISSAAFAQSGTQATDPTNPLAPAPVQQAPPGPHDADANANPKDASGSGSAEDSKRHKRHSASGSQHKGTHKQHSGKQRKPKEEETGALPADEHGPRAEPAPEH